MATWQMRHRIGVARVGGVPGPELILPPGHRFTWGPVQVGPFPLLARTRGCRLPACTGSSKGLEHRSVGEYAYHAAKGMLGMAVQELVGTGDIKERLYEAAKEIALLSPDQMPEYLRDDFLELRERLNWLLPEEEGLGRVPATMMAMSDAEADELGKKFFELYDQVSAASRDAL
jgi:hypothetical protein